jgi:hypothetical protein
LISISTKDFPFGFAILLLAICLSIKIFLLANSSQPGKSIVINKKTNVKGFLKKTGNIYAHRKDEVRKLGNQEVRRKMEIRKLGN